MKPRLRVLSFACAAVLGATTVASATTMIPLTIEQLTERASAVVRGHTVATHSAWDGHGRIVTHATVQVEQSYAGGATPGASLDVATYGGTVDGTSMLVIGAPSFSVGEEVVLFLAPQGALGNGIAELGQGKFEVQRDAAGQALLTRRALEGVDFVRGAAPEPVLNLSLLEFHVSRAARAGR
jgi:hypothetical protein